jgi:DNA invertase Pin-like site-specific DNA recombinase
VSTDEQAASGNGLAAQRSTISTEANRRGWDVEFVSDEGGSWRYVNPGLRACLEKLAAGRADALIVAKMDRLSRSVANAADILNAAKAQGWDLVVCDLGVDLSTPQGRAMANMLATFAELERDLISQRTREGLAAAKAAGKRIGRPRLTPTELVNRICKARDAGESFDFIARTLTDEGVLSPAGKPVWQPSTVRRIYKAATQDGAA